MQAAVFDFTCDAIRTALPRPEADIVVRCGATGDGAVDLHAVGARERVRRKCMRAGMRVMRIRIPIGATATVLGVSAASLSGRIVPLEDLWGAPARELAEQIAEAHDGAHAKLLAEQAVYARIARASRLSPAQTGLAVAAAARLTVASVRDVAEDLGVSERQLRRVFRDVVGVGPKSFARLARFQRAIEAARHGGSWTRIAAASGYCDQAHLIDEFRAIAGTTPSAFLTELRDSIS